jgi:hypothetical protein
MYDFTIFAKGVFPFGRICAIAARVRHRRMAVTSTIDTGLT